MLCGSPLSTPSPSYINPLTLVEQISTTNWAKFVKSNPSMSANPISQMGMPINCFSSQLICVTKIKGVHTQKCPVAYIFFIIFWHEKLHANERDILEIKYANYNII